MTLDLLIALSLGAVGLVMGSAVTALAHRLPRGLSWTRGRSACPRCGTPLAVRDLVPVLSFALSRGSCRHCGERIAWRYPLTELLCAAWAVLLYRHVGLGATYPFLAVWGFLMIALLWIDLDFQLLPDALTLPGTLVALAAALQLPLPAARPLAFLPALAGFQLHGATWHALSGILVGAGLLWLIGEAYYRLRNIEGLGGGDIKLAAMFGAVLGWKLTLLTLFLGALAGSLWGGWLMLRGRGSRMTPLPFGTLLAPAALVAFLWGADWMNAYLGSFIAR